MAAAEAKPYPWMSPIVEEGEPSPLGLPRKTLGAVAALCAAIDAAALPARDETLATQPPLHQLLEAAHVEVARLREVASELHVRTARRLVAAVPPERAAPWVYVSQMLTGVPT